MDVNPFAEMRPDRHMTLNEELDAIRQDIAAEMGAISLYQGHIDTTSDPDFKSLLSEIRDEEKTHFTELTNLLEIKDSGRSTRTEHSDMPLAQAITQSGLLRDIAAAGMGVLSGTIGSSGVIPALLLGLGLQIVRPSFARGAMVERLVDGIVDGSASLTARAGIGMLRSSGVPAVKSSSTTIPMTGALSTPAPGVPSGRPST